jgi:hypothetical protein
LLRKWKNLTEKDLIKEIFTIMFDFTIISLKF